MAESKLTQELHKLKATGICPKCMLAAVDTIKACTDDALDRGAEIQGEVTRYAVNVGVLIGVGLGSVITLAVLAALGRLA